MLIEMTPLQRIWIPHRWKDQYTLARQRILYLLDQLPEVARNPAPTFTLAHILCPHLPFIFDENGEDVSKRNVGFTLVGNDRVMGRFRDPEAFQRAYRNQAAF